MGVGTMANLTTISAVAECGILRGPGDGDGGDDGAYRSPRCDGALRY